MNENLKQAILKVKEMPEVQEKLTKAETLEEVYEIMQSVGSGFTLDEFEAAMEEMNKAGSGELTDEQLDAAAGGALSLEEYVKLPVLASKKHLKSPKFIL